MFLHSFLFYISVIVMSIKIVCFFPNNCFYNESQSSNFILYFYFFICFISLCVYMCVCTCVCMFVCDMWWWTHFCKPYHVKHFDVYVKVSYFGEEMVHIYFCQAPGVTLNFYFEIFSIHQFKVNMNCWPAWGPSNKHSNFFCSLPVSDRVWDIIFFTVS